MEGMTVVKCEPEWSDTEESSSCFWGLPLEADRDDTGNIKIKLEGIATLVPKVERVSSPSAQYEDCRRFQQLPWEADVDDIGDIKNKLEGITTLVPKVEKESSPFGQCIATLVPKVERESSPLRQCIAKLVPKVERESSPIGQCLATLVPKFERESSPIGQCEDYKRDEEQLPLCTNDRTTSSSDIVKQNETKKQGRTGYSRDVEEPSFQQVGENDHNYAIPTWEPGTDRGGGALENKLGKSHITNSYCVQPLQSILKSNFLNSCVEQNDLRTYAKASARTCTPPVYFKTPTDNKKHYSLCDKGLNLKASLNRHVHTQVGGSDHNYAMPTRDLSIGTPGTHAGGDVLENKLVKSHITKSHCVQPLQSRLKKNLLNLRCMEQNARRSSNFPFHLLARTNNKKYCCCLCDKSFILKASLKRHILTHAGVDSFVSHVGYKPFIIM